MFLQVSRLWGLWGRIPRPVRRWFLPTLLVAVAVVALSFVPVVSANVPGMKALSSTVRKALGMKTTTSKAAPKRTQKAAPKAAQKPAAKPVQTAAPAKAAAALPFTVKSTPSGATVQVNGRPLGKTPVTLKLAAGTHKLTITRPGYAPVYRTVTVKKGGTASLTVKLPTAAAASKPKAGSAPAAAKPAQAVTSVKLLSVGARAPAFSLKDSIGRGHSLAALRGRKVVVLFVWTLDAKTKALIEDLDGHVRSTDGERPALVVLAGGDAAAVQKYAAAAGLRVPLLLGGEATAQSYGVARGSIVLYVVSESGTISVRQDKNIMLDPLFPRVRG